MPVGHRLTAYDRRELYTRLVQEYFAVDQSNVGILKSWLLGKSQEGVSAFKEAGLPSRAWEDSPEHQR
jgi:hypothetical protein